MTELTIKRHEDGHFSLLTEGLAANGKSVEEVLVKAAKLKGVRTFTDTSQVRNDFEMGELVEGLFPDRAPTTTSYELAYVKSRAFYGEELTDLLADMNEWLKETEGSLLATRTDYGDGGWHLTAFAECF